MKDEIHLGTIEVERLRRLIEERTRMRTFNGDVKDTRWVPTSASLRSWIHMLCSCLWSYAWHLFRRFRSVLMSPIIVQD